VSTTNTSAERSGGDQELVARADVVDIVRKKLDR